MMSKNRIIIFGLVGVAAFIAIAIYLTQSAEGSAYQCPTGLQPAYCTQVKKWCSNNGVAAATYECGCSCSTASCQDGNVNTLNTCASTCASYDCYSIIYTHPITCEGPQCTSYTGVCSSQSCPSGKIDLNNNPADGCETSLLTSNSNCGSVGNACTGLATCQNGVCVVPFDFNVSLGTTSGIANRGDVKNSNVSVSLVTGSGSTSLSASSVPTGTVVSFSPTSCSPNCYSNMTINTSATTPLGSSIISVTGTSGALVRSNTYNLTVLPSSGIATCGNLACDYPETQVSCPSDCFTNTSMPSPVTPGEIVSISAEFHDFRYLANEKVRIDLKIDGTTPWTPSNGCIIGGVKMGPSSTGGATAWPSGTTSQDGYFKVTALCTMPAALSAGAHTLSATPTIF